MKIAFMGASGTGKTTLVEHLKQAFDLPSNPMTTRGIAKAMGLDSPYDADRVRLTTWEESIRVGLSMREAVQLGIQEMDEQSKSLRARFQETYLKQKIDWEAKADRFVTDRTPVELWAYFALHAPDEISEPFIDAAIAHTQTYDLVFFLPIESFHHTAGDPARKASKAYHRTVDVMLKGMIASNFAQKVYRVSSSILEDRQQFVRRIFEDASSAGV